MPAGFSSQLGNSNVLNLIRKQPKAGSEHIKATKPTVLISPSLQLGLDLKCSYVNSKSLNLLLKLRGFSKSEQIA